MEALAYLESCDTIPDLILLDIMMPGLNGYQVHLMNVFLVSERIFILTRLF